MWFNSWIKTFSFPVPKGYITIEIITSGYYAEFMRIIIL